MERRRKKTDYQKKDEEVKRTPSLISLMVYVDVNHHVYLL